MTSVRSGYRGAWQALILGCAVLALVAGCSPEQSPPEAVVGTQQPRTTGPIAERLRSDEITLIEAESDFFEATGLTLDWAVPRLTESEKVCLISQLELTPRDSGTIPPDELPDAVRVAVLDCVPVSRFVEDLLATTAVGTMPPGTIDGHVISPRSQETAVLAVLHIQPEVLTEPGTMECYIDKSDLVGRTILGVADRDDQDEEQIVRWVVECDARDQLTLTLMQNFMRDPRLTQSQVSCIRATLDGWTDTDFPERIAADASAGYLSRCGF